MIAPQATLYLASVSHRGVDVSSTSYGDLHQRGALLSARFGDVASRHALRACNGLLESYAFLMS